MAGAIQTTTNPTDVLNRMQTYFNRKMLEPTKENLVRAQWAQTGENVPGKQGTLTMRFYKRRPAQTKDVTTLTQGTPITTYTEMSVGHVDVTLSQMGEAAKISDIRLATDIFDVLAQNVQVLGEDCALKAETVARNVIIAGLLNGNNNFERFGGVTNTGNSANDFTTLAGLTAANSKLTRARALACATQLKVNKVPTIGGGYVCALPSEVMHDLRLDDDWLGAAKYSNVKALYNREEIMLDGVRYVENTAAWAEGAVYGTEETAAPTIYACEFYGRGAFGCPKLEGTNDPWSPKIIINKDPDKSDPLNQFVVLGWKSLWNAVLLKVSGSTGNNSFTDVPHCVVLRVKSTFA